MNLFQQIEQGFDKLFSYNRQLLESLEYTNTMKNGSMDDKLKMQEQELQLPERLFTSKKRNEVQYSCEKENMISCNLDNKQNSQQPFNQGRETNEGSLLSIFSLGNSNNHDTTLAEESQAKKPNKKKKRSRSI